HQYLYTSLTEVHLRCTRVHDFIFLITMLITFSRIAENMLTNTLSFSFLFLSRELTNTMDFNGCLRNLYQFFIIIMSSSNTFFIIIERPLNTRRVRSLRGFRDSRLTDNLLFENQLPQLGL
ncbi:hypothetical protein L9F63_003023, partial [Diploptera punctata]